MDEELVDKRMLMDIVTTRMPFGKYMGTLICDLPEAYLLWFKRRSWPKGYIGKLLQNTYEMKQTGSAFLFEKLKEIAESEDNRY